MGKNKCPECPKEATWKDTYGDMITLLLCFFVVLFSFAEIDAQKFEAVMQSFQGSLGVMEGGKTISELPYIAMGNLPEEMTTDQYEDVETMKNLKQEVESYTKAEGLGDSVEVVITERGIIIRIMDSVFFDSGKATLKSEAKEILIFVGQILNSPEILERQIKIEGHTDTDIINTREFPSNWELSSIRAVNVLRLFEEQLKISSDRLSASGYGPTRPVAPNDTPQNKALNRRVDIVILNDKAADKEPK